MPNMLISGTVYVTERPLGAFRVTVSVLREGEGDRTLA